MVHISVIIIIAKRVLGGGGGVEVGGVVTYGHEAISASPSLLVFLHATSTMGPTLASQRTLQSKH